MVKKVLKELCWTAATIWAALSSVFLLVYLSPTGPFDNNPKMPEEVKHLLMSKFGLDQPWYVQYHNYWADLFNGDLGPSYHYQGREVVGLITEALPVTLQLSIPALLLAAVFGILTGMFAAARQNQLGDYAVMGVAMLGISFPNIVIAPILVLIFAMWLQWLPAQGWGTWQHMILPIVTLSLYYYGVLARMTRGGMIEALQRGYVRTARAKGASEWRTITRHAMRGGTSDTITMLGVIVAAMITTGPLVVESIFNIPGLGSLFLASAMKTDITLIMGTALFAIAAYLACNRIVDIILFYRDPRNWT